MAEDLLNKEIIDRVKNILKPNDKGNFSYKKLEKQKKLVQLSSRLFEHIEPVCWKTEINLAKELGTSVRQIKYAKAYLLIKNKIEIQLRQNGNRKNLRHVIFKKIKTAPKSKPNYYQIDWSILSNYSPNDFKLMSVEDQLDIYTEMNLPFIPLHYPKFKKGKVYCSCKRGRKCDSIGKHPAIKFKELDFSKKSTFYQMKDFWTEKDNRYNIGFLTNNFAVIDIDFRHFGNRSLKEIEDIYGEIPKDLIVKTGNGFHIYVSNVMASSVNLLNCSGIDVRSKGGLVVAPFSQHSSGVIYEWDSLSTPKPLPVELANDIKAVINNIEPKKIKTSITGGNHPQVKLPSTFDSTYVIADGLRNRTIYCLAARMRSKGKEYYEILNFIEKINEVNCQPPLDDFRLKHIAKCVVDKYVSNAQKGLPINP